MPLLRVADLASTQCRALPQADRSSLALQAAVPLAAGLSVPRASSHLQSPESLSFAGRGSRRHVRPGKSSSLRRVVGSAAPPRLSAAGYTPGLPPAIAARVRQASAALLASSGPPG